MEQLTCENCGCQDETVEPVVTDKNSLTRGYPLHLCMSCLEAGAAEI
jgi:hypothetical protein